MNLSALSSTDRAALNFLNAYVNTHGVSPSGDQFSIGTGYSVPAFSQTMRSLKEKGMITHEESARGDHRLTEKGFEYLELMLVNQIQWAAPESPDKGTLRDAIIWLTAAISYKDLTLGQRALDTLNTL